LQNSQTSQPILQDRLRVEPSEREREIGQRPMGTGLPAEHEEVSWYIGSWEFRPFKSQARLDLALVRHER